MPLPRGRGSLEDHPTHSPLNTSVAGPVMKTGWSSPAHSSSGSPPGRWASSFRPVRPAVAVATVWAVEVGGPADHEERAETMPPVPVVSDEEPPAPAQRTPPEGATFVALLSSDNEKYDAFFLTWQAIEIAIVSAYFATRS